MAMADATKTARSVEQVYQKKSQLEHILLRPDSYSKLFRERGGQWYCHNVGGNVGYYVMLPQLDQWSRKR